MQIEEPPPQAEQENSQPDYQASFHFMLEAWNEIGYGLARTAIIITNTIAEAAKLAIEAIVRAFIPQQHKHMLLHPSRQTRLFLSTKQHISFTPHAHKKHRRVRQVENAERKRLLKEITRIAEDAGIYD